MPLLWESPIFTIWRCTIGLTVQNAFRATFCGPSCCASPRNLHEPYLQWYDKGHEQPLRQIVDKLKEKGAYDNTVFIIVADHGQRDVNGDDAHSIVLEEWDDEEIEEVIEGEYDDIYDFYDEDEYDSFAGFNTGVLQIYLKNRGKVEGESAHWHDGPLPNYPNFWTDVLPAVRAIRDHRCWAIMDGSAEIR